MRILFAHQGGPAQFRYLAAALAAARQEVVFFSLKPARELPGVRYVFYDLALQRDNVDGGKTYISPVESALVYAEAAARAAESLKKEGFYPDLMLAHSGWSESMFFKDIFPNAPLVHFFEAFLRTENFFWNAPGSAPMELHDRKMLRMRNLPQLHALHTTDWGFSPTAWQKQLFPMEYHPRISAIHDCINTDKFHPRDDLELVTPGKRLRKGMEIVTFIARNLEPCRGFESFMQAAEIILRERPHCEIVIFGGDGADHGPRLTGGQTYRQRMLEKVRIDPGRVHFMGRAPHSQIVAALAVSAAHVFLTYPHLISWSILEALAAGCVVIGSATGPVMEIIEHGRNGFLVEFFDYRGLAAQVCEVLAKPEKFLPVRMAARDTALRKYDLRKNVSREIALLSILAAGQLPPEEPTIPQLPAWSGSYPMAVAV